MQEKKLKNNNYLYYVVLFLVVFISSFKPLVSQTILKEKFNKENFYQFDSYIKKYAPADSAFRVMLFMANRNRSQRRFAAARQVYVNYGKFFPNRAKEIKKDFTYNEVMMLCTTPDKTLIPFYIQYVKDSADTDDGYLALQRIADNYINHFAFDSAATLYRKFLPLFPNNDKLQKTIDILETPLQNLEIHHLGPNVNTKAGEWDPNPTPDGRYLYFSTYSRKGSYGGHDVYVSEFKNGQWQKAINVGPKINGPNNETIDNISADGNTVCLSGTFDGTFGKFDIYLVRRTKEGWGPLEHLPYPINTQYHDEGANITSDGKALLFTSDRPGGIGPYVPNGYYYHGTQDGNMDVYVCLKTDNGWSKPINLGPKINTPYAERSPFLHPDGKTLYFSSDGHAGLGRMDVFKAVRLRDDSWTEWSEPVNLGKEINTVLDDWGYKVAVGGDSAFFARQWSNQGYGDWDIYTVELPDPARPRPVVTIMGKVTDQNGNPLEATIKWENLENGMPLGTLHSNPEDGSYIILLPTGKNIGYYAEREGYYSASDNIDLSDINVTKTIKRDIQLVSIADMTDKGINVTMKNIFFDFDKFELKPASFPELNRLVQLLKDKKDLKIRIEGHTDIVGSDAYNLELSKKRALAVKNYLVKKGINKKRLSVKGFGSRKPVADNDTEEGKAKNRRVEISFYK
jgi:outer membrane protein OmpA-like peptidoglycan-associated protein